MVGLVIVSHSARLAEGVAELARGVGGAELALAATGGLDLPGQPLGTDALLVLRAIEAVYADDGVVVLMDLGSAVLSAELALDLLPAERREHVVLCEAPLVEGAVAAAVQARLGSPLSQVLAEGARRAGGEGGASRRRDPEPATEAAVKTEAGATLESGATSAAGARSETHERRLRVRNAAGLHARPAAAFVRAAGRFGDADIALWNLTAGRGPADARSINAVITLGVRQGDEILLTASGPGAQAALDALARAVDEHAEGGAADAEPWAAQERLAGGNGRTSWPFRGIPASPGIAVGTVQPYPAPQPPGSVLAPPDAQPGLAAADPQAEWAALQAALARTAGQIRATRDAVAVRAGRTAAEIFEAQLLFLGDDALLAPVRSAIFESGSSAAAAWQAAVDRVAERYAALDDEALRSRRADLLDVGRQVLANLSGAGLNLTPAPFAGPGILVARELSPTEAAHLDPDLVLGVCTALGGPTSHAAILARALGIPYVAGLGEAVLALSEGALLAMDGAAGGVWPDPPPELIAECVQRAAADRAARAEARLGSARPAVTRDGHRVEIGANIGSIRDAGAAVDFGADGVGLFRTEFLFGDRQDPPGEDGAGRGLSRDGRGVGWAPRWSSAPSTRAATNPCPISTCRLKPTPSWAGEVSGCACAQPEIFTVQLRAIVRVAAEYPVKVMFPMIATLGEWRAAVALLAAARGEVLARGRPPRTAAISSGSRQGSWSRSRPRRCCPGIRGRSRFLPIGTNDLTQYTLAAERGNARLAALADPLARGAPIDPRGGRCRPRTGQVGRHLRRAGG